MGARLRRLAVPAYLLLCLLLGGSVQGIWRVMLLQLLAVGLIAWAALSPKSEPLTKPSKRLLLLVVLVLFLFVLQLIPLSPEIWAGLPGRSGVATGYASLGYPLPWLPLSMVPYETLETALTLLPPIAVLVGILRLRAYQESWLAGALIVGALLGVTLGAVQSIGESKPEAWWYLYDITNTGAVGFFANSNHMGTLLLVTIPFAAALIAAGMRQTPDRRRFHAVLAVGAGGLLVVLVGLALNRSLAAIALALPVIALSALLLPGSWQKQRLILVAAALLTVAGVLAFTSSPIQAELTGTDTTSLGSRLAMWRLSWAAISDSFPAGTGFGTFEQIFRLYEDPASVGATYVNHAHNDYIELVLEAGLAGLLLLGAFLLWWMRQVIEVWRSQLSSPFARAATIATGAVLAHSIVDYPQRTAAIASVFAGCLAMIAQPSKRESAREASEVRPTKHLTIG
jgi:O-antigen ligase